MGDDQVRGWTVEARTPLPPGLTGPLPALVPGCVQLDLIEAGIIGDLAVAGRDDDQLWVGSTPWRYRTTIRRPEGSYDRALLVFEGIDTVARVSVAGSHRLASCNMFRRYELDVTADLARADEVEVVVDLDPVLPLADERERANPLPRPGDYWRPFNQVRKMACSFGWDWGPVTLSAGLWRPVRLVTVAGARFSDVRVSARPGQQGAPGTVTVAAVIEAPAGAVDAALRVDVARNGAVLATGTVPVDGDRAELAVEVPGAELWWPRTEGEQPLYDVIVRLRGTQPGQAAELDVHQARIGFRTVETVQVPDAAGSSFALHVNGRRVWVRGLDWIPDDPFPSRVTPLRYRERLAEAAAAGANTIRVWGGGIYEDDAFYDACDELGLLVIQDFLFACAAYPEDGPMVADVQAEVRDNVRRLRHRASLALWCGNNENLWGHQDWGWIAELGGRAWGLRYYREILPELLAELDGTRPYVPGSPFSPETPDGAEPHPNDQGSGIQHIWDVWNQKDYSAYETWRPRFVSEFGYQGPASWPTLVTAVGRPPDSGDPELDHHQRAGDGAAKLQAGLDRHLPQPPAAGPAWYFATQLVQARAVTIGVCHLRSLHDHCSGAIWWQLNDLWPAVSWSVVDVRGRRKLAWHALRRAFGPRLIHLGAGDAGTATETGGGPAGGLRVVLVNDTGQVWRERVVVRVAGPSHAGVVLEQDVEVPAYGSWSSGLEGVSQDPAALVVIADAGTHRATRWLTGDLALALPPQRAAVTVTPAGGDGNARQLRVTVEAKVLLRDVALLAELAVPDAIVTGQLATLLPGERADLLVTLPEGTGSGGVDWAELIWSDNRLRQPAEMGVPVPDAATVG